MQTCSVFVENFGITTTRGSTKHKKHLFQAHFLAHFQRHKKNNFLPLVLHFLMALFVVWVLNQKVFNDGGKRFFLNYMV